MVQGSQSRSWRWACGFALAIIYLVGHTLSGQDGLLNFMRLQERERALDAELARLDAAEARLRIEIRRLSGSHPDRDLLEERARALVNAVRPGETILLLAP